MILISSLILAEAGVSSLEERTVGVGASVRSNSSGAATYSASLRWQASPRWALEPRAGFYRSEPILESPVTSQSRTWGEFGLTARRYLASRDRVHLAGLAEIDSKYDFFETTTTEWITSLGYKSTRLSASAGVGVEWTPEGPLGIGADLLNPLLTLSRFTPDGMDSSTNLRLGLSPEVRISAHLYF